MTPALPPGAATARPGRVRRALAEPRRAVAVGLALWRGQWYRLYYRARGIRLRVGRNFRVFGRLSVRGPGEVVFGDDVVIQETVTPWTYSKEARIEVGDHVILGGTQFGCVEEITIGRDSLVGQASIMDTDFHSIRADRRSEHAPVRVAAVRIGENVWIAKGAGILPGTVIGRNSVVGFGAVCMREFPPDVVILGNPAKVAMPVPSTPTGEAADRLRAATPPPPPAALLS